MDKDTKERDEDIMKRKLSEHKNTIDLIIEIGKENGIEVEPTYGNDGNGDFYYPLDDEKKLIQAIDKYLEKYKWKKE